jgi:hypothetical protein
MWNLKLNFINSRQNLRSQLNTYKHEITKKEKKDSPKNGITSNMNHQSPNIKVTDSGKSILFILSNQSF